MTTILFDLGFTLIHFPEKERARVREECTRLLAKAGLAYDWVPDERRKRHFELTTGAIDLAELWELLLQTKSVVNPALAKALEEVQLNEKAELYPDALEAIRLLKKKDFNIGILANSWPANELHVKELLDHKVDAVVFSHKLGFRKPHRKAYLALCRELGAEPKDCVFVSDEIYEDLWGARRLGMKTAYVRRERGAGVFQIDPDARVIEPDYETGSLLELAELLKPPQKRAINDSYVFI